MRILRILIALVVCKTVVIVFGNFTDYFPPNFQSDFLLGRESYFFGAYSIAFFTHIITGPATLIMGLILLNKSFLRRFPKWHRRIGKTQVIVVLFLMTPSGLWMARYAATGAVAATGFATLAMATAACVAIGWRAAVQRRFKDHERWMLRCFALLFSAVLIRILGGLSELMQFDGRYRLAAWLSWILPLVCVEAWRFFSPQRRGIASNTSSGSAMSARSNALRD